MTDPMINPLQQVLRLGISPVSLLPDTSRYSSVGSAKLETPDGKTIIFLRRRFVPQPEKFALLEEHTVIQGDRLDNVTALHLGDPEQFWRLCDANRALRPDELTETENIGRRLRITLPEGLQGATE